jgi:hypothetical protein
MNPFTIGLPAFGIGAVLGYLLREYSLGRLSAIETGTLSVDLRPTRLRYIWYMGATLAGFLVLRFSFPNLMNWWFLIFLSVYALGTIGFEVYAWRKFIAGRYPRGFVTPYAISRVLTVSGVLALACAMAAMDLV